jgi:hypothetical protein
MNSDRRSQDSVCFFLDLREYRENSLHRRSTVPAIAGQTLFLPGKKHPREATAAGHQDGVLGAQQAGCFIAKFSNCADFHVVT